MGVTKELKIKNQTYYFLNDIIDIRNFQSNLLKIDKKPYKDFDIYYIGYILIKKTSDYENIHSINPLYLTIYSATRYFKEKNGKKYLILDLIEKYEKNGEKYLILDPIEKYEEFFLELNQKLKQSMVVKKRIMKKIMQELELIQMIMYH